MDGLFHDSETLKWTYEIDPNIGLSKDDKSTERNCKGVAKRAKGGSSTTTLIKEQWTDEEDRKLLNLVTQHGVRKWAQIAENMVGKARKQCRERWHNHLRPDIKVFVLQPFPNLRKILGLKKKRAYWLKLIRKLAIDEQKLPREYQEGPKIQQRITGTPPKESKIQKGITSRNHKAARMRSLNLYPPYSKTTLKA
ncbi:Transcription factor MYB119 [Camellia lanceoleosa]|uniref:Transcription factor MYB119 n=1 Tax=Camellia lanceoleosa TaxID=1840588 RepID=A0ACC0HQI9_9ERIC|nr:Transcription factor MYB119 [Camellia lanceoleosa]